METINNNLITGKIVWFNETKNFGWIGVKGRTDIFFHRKELQNASSVFMGDQVQFEVGKNSKGDCAKNVRLINPE
jgi:cold shock protein